MKKDRERVYKGKGLTLYHQNFPKKSLGSHSHNESHLIIPLQGAIEMEIDGVTHIVKAGWMLFVDANVKHDFMATGEVGERLIFQFNFNNKKASMCRVSLLPVHQLIKQLALDLFTYKSEHFISSVEDLIKEVIYTVLKKQKNVGNELYHIQSQLLKSTHPQIKKIVEVLENNLENEMGQVAKESNLSPRSLSRLVRAEVGISPNDLMTYFRIQRACELIYKNKLNLTAIAFDCGYSSLSQFIMNFKKWTGARPSEFKGIR